MNGRPLIRHALDHALRWNAKSLTIVCSPENVKALTQVIPQQRNVNWVVQPEPTGVVNAIARGLPFITLPWTLILCADNTFEGDVPTEITGPLFGVRSLPPHDARRFTRYRVRNRNIEMTNLSDDAPRFQTTEDRGVEIIEADADGFGDGCWIGPLLLPSYDVHKALSEEAPPKTIVGLMRRTTNDGRHLTPLPMMCSDMGIPEELL